MEEVIGFEALYDSMQKCKNGVMWKDSTAHFVLNGLEEVLKLERELKAGTYKARPPVSFQVTSPKPRDIISITFRDRVYQRSLNDNAIYPCMVPQFIYDNGACQTKRGTDFSRGRLRCFLQKHFRRYGRSGYVLQCDIKGYYPNMRHDVAKRIFRKKLDDWTYHAVETVLTEQYAGEIGFNPGSQMIQIAGISVLSDLDHMIKEQLRIKYYLRYMDDLVLIHPDEQYLEECRDRIGRYLGGIGFSLHPKKTKIFPLTDGILFLGFRWSLTETGKVMMKLDPQNVRRERRKLKRLVHKCERGELPKAKVYECYAGWRQHASKGNNWKLVRRMDLYLKMLWNAKEANNGTGEETQGEHCGSTREGEPEGKGRETGSTAGVRGDHDGCRHRRGGRRR